MTDLTDREDKTGYVVVFGGVFLAGMVFGHVIGESRISDAMDWAVEQTRECEETYESEGYLSVSDCLSVAIEDAEARAREP